MNYKIVVIGCGNVGLSYIYSLINQKLEVAQLVIIDTNVSKTKGELMDIGHGLSFVNSKIKIRFGDYKDCQDANMVVITAGAKQEQGESRMDLLAKNAKIIKSIVENVVKNNFQGIFLNVTNPLDVMTYLIYKHSKFPAHKVIGSGTALDTSRLKYVLKDIVKADYENIEAYVLGEHGDSLVIPWNSVFVDKMKFNVNFDTDKQNEIEFRVKNAGYELLDSKGYSSSAVGMCLAYITKIILNDEQIAVCLSSYDDKEDIYYGHPVKLGKSGIMEEVPLNLTALEQQKLNESLEIIKNAIKKVI